MSKPDLRPYSQRFSIFKPCKRCGEERPLQDYSAKVSKRFRNKVIYGTVCNPCKKRRNKVKQKQNHYRKYGISEEKYNELVKNQEGKCAICLKIPKSKLHVDHDHKTGKLRFLLCNFCNAGLGFFKDSPEFLESAIAYLNFHSPPKEAVFDSIKNK